MRPRGAVRAVFWAGGFVAGAVAAALGPYRRGRGEGAPRGDAAMARYLDQRTTPPTR